MAVSSRPILSRPILAGLVLTALAFAAGGVEAQRPATEEPTFDEMGLAVLQGLDKVTARVWTLDVPVGEATRFGTLRIDVESCRRRPPVEPPESAAFLTISDHLRDGSVETAFEGWMFASSPALSALEHPVYDIWVLECREGGSASTTAVTPDSGGRSPDADQAEGGDSLEIRLESSTVVPRPAPR